MSLLKPAPFAVAAKAQQPRQTRRSLIVRAAQDPYAPDEKVVKDDVLAYAKTLPGISEPFPNIFDPLNFLGSATSVREVKRWREAEVTHGRVSMLAALGFVAQEQLTDYHVLLNSDGHITGPAINHFQQVEEKGAIFWLPLLFAIALAESYRVGRGWNDPTSENFNTLRDDYAPGELNFDPLGLLPSDPKEKYDLQTKELNNGRLAMIAVAAFVAQELRVQHGIFEGLFSNGSPPV
jgi:light-harvesting complex I chlorophyll a/b binding protein 1